jgi:hypothetical protein
VDRTEHVEGANSEPREFDPLLVESALDLFARHRRTIERAGWS